MLREAASRLQQKIQKHLLDSEDGKMLDDLAAEKGHNLDRTRDKMVSMEDQVKPLLENMGRFLDALASHIDPYWRVIN